MYGRWIEMAVSLLGGGFECGLIDVDDRCGWWMEVTNNQSGRRIERRRWIYI